MSQSQAPSGQTHSLLHTPTRRQWLGWIAGAGVGGATFQRALAQQAEPAGELTPAMIQNAEWIAGISLTEADRKALTALVSKNLRDYAALRAVALPYSIPPALVFQVHATAIPPSAPGKSLPAPVPQNAVPRPHSPQDLAFLPLAAQAALLRQRAVSSVDLTKLYLERLRRYDLLLHCVVSVTEELALRQAELADRELAAGRDRGPLHGIPWGAKDLIAYPGFKTTWGAGHYKDQTLGDKASVAERLEAAGAVLVAKTTLGALAMGDQWFGGMTRNPWNPKQGSSGSSAGSASAVVAGLVGFAIGSETLGSIISPCTRCGATGLRPTFGRISRHGCMTLSWSMDKLGPIARSAEDCALIFASIHGSDPRDPSAVDRPFSWPCPRDLKSLRVGYVPSERQPDSAAELKVLRDLGVQLVPIQLPTQFPADAMRIILTAESATAFDHLTRQGVSDGIGFWARSFRQGQFIPAVEYLRANRVRTLLMQAMEDVFRAVDLYVGGDDLLLTNLTGHPTVVLPNGFKKGLTGVESPTSITFTGRLFGESELLALAHAYQDATGFHRKHPNLDAPKEPEPKTQKNPPTD